MRDSSHEPLGTCFERVVLGEDELDEYDLTTAAFRTGRTGLSGR